MVKIGDLLARQGIMVPQRTLHRYATACTAYRGRGDAGTVPVVDGEPGVECQIDFGQMGKVFDAESGRRRVVHALIFTAVYSRHMFVWLTFNQTLEAIIAGCEAAWRFYGGVFKVLIPDNMTPILPKADSTDPQFSVGWTEYSQARGFFTDPARVRHPQDKPRVERMVGYVRGNFFAGEDFADLADAQARAQVWCADKAGQRIHGTTCQRPAVVFAEGEAALLLPAPAAVYQVPIYAEAKVHRDYHIQVDDNSPLSRVSRISTVEVPELTGSLDPQLLAIALCLNSPPPAALGANDFDRCHRLGRPSCHPPTKPPCLPGWPTSRAHLREEAANDSYRCHRLGRPSCHPPMKPPWFPGRPTSRTHLCERLWPKNYPDRR